MAKMIAVYGSPGSGKTSVAMKMAIEAYMQTKDVTIMFVSSDMNVPSNALIFPNYNPDEVCSLSSVLDKTAITEEEILKNSVTVKSMQDFACLGFKSGENKLSFAKPTTEKINSLFDAMANIAGYIFVDCSSDCEDLISVKALSVADVAVRVITPDLKGVTWFKSNKNGARIEGENLFNVVNTTERELYLPTEEVCTNLHSLTALLPYSKAIKQQMLDGRLYERLNDKAYNRKIRTLVGKLI